MRKKGIYISSTNNLSNITQESTILEHHGWTLMHSGKVRELYTRNNLADILIVTSDRFSAYDHTFQQPFINSSGSLHKGEVLATISKKWFEILPTNFKHHCLSRTLLLQALQDELQELTNRSMLVKNAKSVKLEAVVRGHLVGSAFQEYKEHGTICGISLPSGLIKYDRLPKPIFTPSTKANKGSRDENLNENNAQTLIGKNLYLKIKEVSLSLFDFAANYCEKRGVILLDSKFEFGINSNNELMIIDEICTPDSSRFLLKKDLSAGMIIHHDKQYIRDKLRHIDWSKKQTELPTIESTDIDTLLNHYQTIDSLLFD